MAVEIVLTTTPEGTITASHAGKPLGPPTPLAALPRIATDANPFRNAPVELGQRLYPALGGAALTALLDADADRLLYLAADEAAQPDGGLVGGLASGLFVVRPGLRGPLLVGAVGMAVGMAALGLTTSLVPAMVAMAVFAAGDLLTEVAGTTILQRVVPDAVRGRAIGTIFTVSILANAVGALVLPIAAGVVGIGAVLIACGAIVFVGIAIAVVLVGSTVDRAPAPEVVTAASRVAALPVFGGVPESSLISALGRATEVQVPGGTVVIRQGDPADRFYVILEGRFVVGQVAEPGAPPTQLRAMGVDEVFGEIGLLTGVPRTATVTADGDGRLLALDAPDFLELVTVGAELGPRLLALHRGGAPVGG
ncbi:MAG: cyclic nucleotide-binding domain-containing protein [Chloroflexota bacterium]